MQIKITRSSIISFIFTDNLLNLQTMKTYKSPALIFSMHCSKEAGKKILSMRSRPMRAKHKQTQHNIVTAADYASEKFIVDAIKAKFPSHGIVSEESGIINPNSDEYWIIDPLDGTSNFAAGLDWFGVMMAHVKNGEIQCGVAYLPAFKRLYHAEKGNGACVNLKRISVKEDITIENSLCAFGIDAEGSELLVKKQFQIIKKVAMACRNVRSTNCLFDFCLVAEGKFGGVVNFNMKIWDIAPLSIIVSAAGGVVTDLEGNPIDFTFSKNILEKEYAVVAGAPKVHQALLEIIKESCYPSSNQS